MRKRVTVVEENFFLKSSHGPVYSSTKKISTKIRVLLSEVRKQMLSFFFFFSFFFFLFKPGSNLLQSYWKKICPTVTIQNITCLQHHHLHLSKIFLHRLPLKTKWSLTRMPQSSKGCWKQLIFAIIFRLHNWTNRAEWTTQVHIGFACSPESTIFHFVQQPKSNCVHYSC